jgi:hypothetical protein
MRVKDCFIFQVSCFRLLSLFVCIASVTGVMEQAWAHSEEAAIAVRTYTPIEVDGSLQDWCRRIENTNWPAKMQCQKGDVTQWMRTAPTYINALTSHIESGTVTDSKDFSATVYTLWDGDYLYWAAIVRDNEVVTQHEGEDIWQDDTLEVWLDCRHDAVTHTLFQDDEYQLGFSPASQYRNEPAAMVWRNPDTALVISGMKVGSSLTDDGYQVEGSVALKTLNGCKPSEGSFIGLNFSFVDKDKDQLWTHITWSGQLHSDPSQFGHLYFVDAPVDLFPSDIFDEDQQLPGNDVMFQEMESDTNWEEAPVIDSGEKEKTSKEE